MSARPCFAALALTLLGPVGVLATAADATAAPSCALLIACPPEIAPADPPPDDDLADDPEEAPPPSSTTEQPPAPAPAAESPPPESPATESPAAATASLLRMLNDERSSRGLPTFTLRSDVSEIAMSWSRHLAAAGKLSHNDAYFTSDTRRRLGARALGENVAMNPTIAAAHKALMESPHHRDNILDRRFLVIGLGVEYKNGWWVTENFLQPVNAPAAHAAPAAPASAPRGAPRPAVMEARVTAISTDVPEPGATEAMVAAFAPSVAQDGVDRARPAGTDDAEHQGRAPAAAAGFAAIAGLAAALFRARPRRGTAIDPSPTLAECSI